MKINTIASVLIIYFSLVLCKNKDYIPPTNNEVYEAVNKALEDGIYKTYHGIIKYDIRGNFNYEYTDSLIFRSLIPLDSVIKEIDIKYMIFQYNLLKSKNIDSYLKRENYKEKKNEIYTKSDSVDYQFYISPPLFTTNKTYFVLFCIGTAIRPNSFVDGFYFLFIKRNNDWVLNSIIKSESTTPPNISNAQSHSFIPN